MSFLRSRRIRKSRAVVAGVALVLISSALALSPAGWPAGQRAAQRVALGAGSPFLRAVAWVHGVSRSIWDPIVEGDRLRTENERLRSELARLAVAAAESDRLLEQAEGRLALSEIPRGLGLRYIPAPVLAVGPSQRSRSLIIGCGEADGIQRDMVVLSPPGVAGVVRLVTPHQSLIQLVVDRRSEWGASVGDPPVTGILQGTGEWERLSFVLEMGSEDPVEGDRVVTSGVSGSLFPSGLPIGEVEAVRFDKNGRRVADVRPLAALPVPGEVYVVLGVPPGVEPILEKAAR